MFVVGGGGVWRRILRFEVALRLLLTSSSTVSSVKSCLACRVASGVRLAVAGLSSWWGVIELT